MLKQIINDRWKEYFKAGELQISRVSQKIDETCQDAADYAIRGGNI
jgi:hypothetical protein